jgi:hypothetical protein
VNAFEGKSDGIDTLPLFDIEPVEIVKPEPMSADRRRTQRQAEAVARGSHPLALVFPLIRRHRETVGLEYSATDRKGRDLTCGSCCWREVDEYHGRVYAKCGKGVGARISNGAATDLRSWWPGCTDWKAE